MFEENHHLARQLPQLHPLRRRQNDKLSRIVQKTLTNVKLLFSAVRGRGAAPLFLVRRVFVFVAKCGFAVFFTYVFLRKNGLSGGGGCGILCV